MGFSFLFRSQKLTDCFLPWHVGGTATPGEDTCVIRKGAGLVIPPSLYGGDLIITNIYILI